MDNIIPKLAKYLMIKLGFKQKIKLSKYAKYTGCIDNENIEFYIDSRCIVLYFEDLDLLIDWNAIYWLSKKLGYVR